MNVESRLKELIGEPAGRLHTARSRNDQVATDFRLWVRDGIDGADARARRRCSWRSRARRRRTPTWSCRASPICSRRSRSPSAITCWPMSRCSAATAAGFADARARLNECPLGAAALAGTSFPIDRHMTAEALGFDRPTANSLDAVSDRDFALETLAAAAIAAMHLSRFAEEIVIWIDAAVRLRAAVRQVHHRLLDHAAEAQPRRRRAGARQGRAHRRRRFQALLMVMKGLPLAYSKDMQEDKEPTFDAARRACGWRWPPWPAWSTDLRAQRASAMRAAAGAGFSTATDLADWLVRELGLPFREAHHVTGAIVAAAEARGVALDELPLEEMQAVEPRITDDVFAVLSVRKLGQEPHQLWGNRATERRAKWREAG